MRFPNEFPLALAFLVAAGLAIDLRQQTLTASTTNTTKSDDLLRIAN